MRSVIFIFMLALSPFAWAQTYVEVTGDADLAVSADYVQLSIGLDSRHKSAAKAAKDNAIKMATLVDFMLAQQVAKTDMQTQQLNLQAHFDYDRQQVTSYTASRTMRVKFRRMDQVDQFLVDLAELGGNRVQGYQAGIDDPQQWQNKLLQLAVENGRKKAEVIVASLQQNIGPAILITEGSQPLPQPRAQMARMAVAADAIPASTQVGDIKLQTSLRIRFALTTD